MKKQVYALCLLAMALLGTVSADNLFFKVMDSDIVDANIKPINITSAEIMVCVSGDAPFTSGGGTGDGGGGGGGAGGEGDAISVTPSTPGSGCLTGISDYKGEASFNIEYQGLDQMDLWYTIQRSGYKNASGSVSMIVLGIAAPSMGSVTISRPILDVVTNDLSKSNIRWESLTLDLTQWALSKSPWLRQGLYNKCYSGGCTYASKYVNVSMQGTGNVFRLRWGDIFPACAADYSGSVDTVRCAAEFLVPNLHLQSYVSLTWQMFLSIFRLELSVQGLFDWVLGIITPLLIMALIFVYEVVKTYLLFALTYLSWTTLISVLVRQNIISASALAWIIPLTIVAIFLGSVWLIGSDINLWKPLLIW